MKWHLFHSSHQNVKPVSKKELKKRQHMTMNRHLQSFYAKHFRFQQQKLAHNKHAYTHHGKHINLLQIFNGSQSVSSNKIKKLEKIVPNKYSIYQNINQANAWNNYRNSKSLIIKAIDKHIPMHTTYDDMILSELLDKFYISYGIIQVSDDTNRKCLSIDIPKVKTMHNNDWPVLDDLRVYLDGNAIGNKYVYNQSYLINVISAINKMSRYNTYTSKVSDLRAINKLKAYVE